MVNNYPWNKYHENLLKKWAEMSKTYSIMHSLCAEYYNNWHKRLGIPVVLIGAVTASSIFSSNKEQSELWIYANGGLALLVTGLAGISNFVGTVEKTTKHQNASYKYTKIAMDIDTMLSFSREERNQSPQEFIHSSKAAILEIRENVPEILPWILADYLNKFDKALVNTKSRINKKTYIEAIKYPKSSKPKNNNDSSSPDSHSYNPDDIINTVQSPGLQEKRRRIAEIELMRQNQELRSSGEILADFDDGIMEDICSANEKIQRQDTDFEESEESDEEVDLEDGRSDRTN
jgi:hypothetical protein